MFSIILRLLALLVLFFGIIAAIEGLVFGPDENSDPLKFALMTGALVIPSSLFLNTLGKHLKPSEYKQMLPSRNK